MEGPIEIAVVVLVLPLAAFFVQILFSSRLPRQGDWLPTTAMGTCAVLAVALFGHNVMGSEHGMEPVIHSWEWLTIGAPADDAVGNVGQISGVGVPGDAAGASEALERALGPGGATTVIRFGIQVDNLTSIMLVVVTVVSFLVHLYSIGYMRHHDGRPEDRYGRFFAFLALFSFSMIGLVLADSLLFLFIFWELVGVCSYFLIGFYFTKQSACKASMKAFLTTKIGDLGFMVAIFMIGLIVAPLPLAALGLEDTAANAEVYHAFSFAKIFASVQHGIWSAHIVQLGPKVMWAIGILTGLAALGAAVTAARGKSFAAGCLALTALGLALLGVFAWNIDLPSLGFPLLTCAALALFLGPIGKSAQFPLHVWLPDAMEGPTPVSALIHAATMVAAGVYLVARCFPFFAGEGYFSEEGFYLLSSTPLLTVALIGAITALGAATIAIVQTDIKAVLAYSTISQLGYMMIGIGVGSFAAGMFHLWTHAFFKALLFLGAGSVIHAVGTNEMPEMGGLRKKMPITFVTFLIATMAIAGVPFLSGFYSKEAILTQALALGLHGDSLVYYVPFLFGAAAAAMTAFYMFRIIFLTFVGTPRNKKRYDHAHESPAVMTGPLVTLAGLAIFSAGVFGIGHHWFADRANNEILVRKMMSRSAEELIHPPAAHHGGAGEHGAEHAGAADHGEGAHHVPPGLRGLHAAGDHSEPMTAFLDSEHGAHLPTLMISLMAAAFGIFGCYSFFASGASARGERISGEAGGVTGGFRNLLVNLYYIDWFYFAFFVDGVLWIRQLFRWFDENVIDRFVNWVAKVVTWVSGWSGQVDYRGVDGGVRGISDLVLWGGGRVRRLQTGKLQEYLVGSVFVLGVLLVVVIVWSK